MLYGTRKERMRSWMTRKVVNRVKGLYEERFEGESYQRMRSWVTRNVFNRFLNSNRCDRYDKMLHRYHQDQRPRNQILQTQRDN